MQVLPALPSTQLLWENRVDSPATWLPNLQMRPEAWEEVALGSQSM